MVISGTTGGAWVASDSWGLVRYAFNGDAGQRYYPNGPKNTSTYRIACSGGAVYVATGSVPGNWGNDYRKDGVHYLLDGQWNTTDLFNDPLFASGANTYGGTVNDILAVAIDSDDPRHAYVGSWDDGVLEFRNGHVSTIYNATNSSLQLYAAYANDGVVEVGGSVFDEDGNLWVTNSNCNNPISVRMRNGTWRSFNPGNVLGGNTLLSDLISAQNGYKWIIRPRGNGLLVFSDGGTPTDASDDHYKVITTFDGQGKLPSADVFSVAEDKDERIWVGTGKGIAVFYNPDQVFSGQNFDAQQILIEQDGNVQILLETEAVSAIAVDGANRKWLGTQNSGLYLVSADGTEQVQHFTMANSPLPSNNITTLGIDATSGEVFIGTDQGLLSYRGDATEGGLTADCATVFPNPVRETYTGPVAITGLLRDSDVRITDMAGNLVYRTISHGGQAIWPAIDMEGKRVGTGVYLVLASDPTGAYNCNTKVLVDPLSGPHRPKPATMLHTTRAVVLRTVRHGDRTTVLKAYTEAFGLRSYAVRAGGKGGVREALLQPLGRLELVVNEVPERDLQQVREVRAERPYLRLGEDPLRAAFALFVQEVLYRTLREEAADPATFAFVQQALEALDHWPELADLPNRFLVHLARHLGFFPEPPEEGEDRFDLREGQFFRGMPPHEFCLDPALAAELAWLMDRPLHHGAPVPHTAPHRRAMLDGLLLYYRLHLPGFGELRSPEVLRAVLR
ncbi:MAG: DNA repair protein RecO C-terminal domain-containing protein [Flavobacteriales bacterium]